MPCAESIDAGEDSENGRSIRIACTVVQDIPSAADVEAKSLFHLHATFQLC